MDHHDNKVIIFQGIDDPPVTDAKSVVV